MASKTLLDRCHVNTNIENDMFVGILKREDYYEVDFPLGYHFNSDEKGLRKDILSLINILEKYSDRRESEIYGGLKNNDVGGIPVQAYLYLIKDFFERGYYKEREKHYQVAKCGKISWRKTIKTQKSVIQDNEAYYLNFVVKNNNMNENELITLVHKYCVYQSFDKFGWLFTSYVPEKPRIGLTNKMMISVVMNKLQNTFTDQNKQLFKNMLATLKKLDDEDQKEFRYGTYKFEYVWEKMIDKVFGISQKVDYFPKTTWSLAGGKLHDNAFLEPDSIMLYAGKVYVLDSKYYKYGWSGAPGHLPQSTSINKQITYGEYIANADKFTKNGKRPAVYNAFLMPYDSKGKKFPTEKPIHYIGTATSDWKSGSEKYENVIGLLIDMKYLMELKGRQDMSEISQLAALIEQFCPV